VVAALFGLLIGQSVGPLTPWPSVGPVLRERARNSNQLFAHFLSQANETNRAKHARLHL